MQGVSYWSTVNQTWYEELDTLKGKRLKAKIFLLRDWENSKIILSKRNQKHRHSFTTVMWKAQLNGSCRWVELYPLWGITWKQEKHWIWIQIFIWPRFLKWVTFRTHRVKGCCSWERKDQMVEQKDYEMWFCDKAPLYILLSQWVTAAPQRLTDLFCCPAASTTGK